MVIYFFYGLSFFCLGLAALLRLRQGGEFPLRKQLPWLAAFGFVIGATAWVDMFLEGGSFYQDNIFLRRFIIISHPLSGLLLLKFGWGIFKDLLPLPTWTIFIPGVMIVPIAYVITYAATTFITPSPIEIPIDIWSRYLLYLPGSIFAGVGFLRQWNHQRKLIFFKVSNLMFATGIAFLFEAFFVGVVVPAAPYGPTSYYNYDRVVYNAFIGDQMAIVQPFGLDYEKVLSVTGFSIEFWRMISAFAVTFFVIKGLDVFDEIRKLQLKTLQDERDVAQQTTLMTQIAARETAERWSDALVNINRQIVDIDHVDNILISIAEKARELLASDFLGIALLEDDLNDLNLKCYSTAQETEMVNIAKPVDNRIIRKVVQNSHYYLSKGNEYLKNICFFVDEIPKTVAGVYLKLDNRPIGAMWVARFTEYFYTEEDLIWLECMADQVVIAIKHGLMTSQLQSLSVTEERARIAREMHDGLAQVLGYLNLQVQTIEALHLSGKKDPLEKELINMRKAIRTAHGDVRENILSLRTTLANKKDFLSAADEYLEEFGIQTDIKTDIQRNTEMDINLSSIAEVQLVCILQEALANVRKHAEAENVKLLISRNEEVDGEYIQMQVIDDGKGFIIGDSKRRFGLDTMSERARSVDGVLLVSSDLGKGTTVTCKIPCLKPESISTRSMLFS
jgi:signal transduction histidine kinase